MPIDGATIEPVPRSVRVTLFSAAGTEVSPVGSGGTVTAKIVDAAGVELSVNHDTADNLTSVKPGYRALSANPTAVTANDRVQAYADLLGRNVVSPYALPGQYTDGADSQTGIGTKAIIATPGAGIRLYITSIQVSADIACEFSIDDDTTVKIRGFLFPAATSQVQFTFPFPLRITADKPLNLQNYTAVAVLRASAQGFTMAI